MPAERPCQMSIADLVKAYAASDPWTVAGFILLLTAATAAGVVGVTKATAVLSFQVSTGKKDAALRTVGGLIALMVVQRLLMFGVDRLDHAMSTQFREFTTARLLRDVVEANRTTLQDVNPMRYKAFVEASASSSFAVLEACLKTYLPNVVMLVALTAYLFYLDVRYGVALLATLALAVVAFVVHKTHLAQTTRAAEARSHAATAFTYDVLACIDTVVAKNTEEQELARVHAALRESAESHRDLGLAMDLGNLAMSGAIIAGVAVITLIGVSKLGIGATAATSAPAILAMLGLVGTLRYRIGSVATANSVIVGQTSRFEANALPDLCRAQGPLARSLVSGTVELCSSASPTTTMTTTTTTMTSPTAMADPSTKANTGTMAEPPSTEPASADPELAAVGAAVPGMAGGSRAARGLCESVRVDFEHVSFRYPGTERAVLSDFSWSIGPGINVLCARSGSGKTTLARLLMRLYEPDAGTIRVNGVPVRDVAVSSLRANVVFSNQDMGLLDRTIREVCMYGTSASEDELASVWASFQDCFHGISLDDRIGLSGGRMSTGMKQVIRLANIRLSNSPCVILDEPFSGLDAGNRDAAIALVRAMAADGRTVLLITHEPDVMLLADNLAEL